MGRRGRKPKEKKGYFYETEEQAICDYIKAENEEEKNRIFNTILYPALTKMIESIIRRYKLYVPDEEFEQTFNDTISYLLTKINNFNPEKGTKAYSYCGTVCKNYLIYRGMQTVKERQRNTPYDTVSDSFENDINYSTDNDKFVGMAEHLIKEASAEIKNMIEHKEKFSLNENEIKVGLALSNLLDKWDDILMGNESNKLQKSSVLYFLREETMMSTKEIRDNMKEFKKIYYLLKKRYVE